MLQYCFITYLCCAYESLMKAQCTGDFIICSFLCNWKWVRSLVEWGTQWSTVSDVLVARYLDDLLQVPPGLLQSLHGEPGVGVRHHMVALDLAVELGQLVEVSLSRAQGRAERVVGFTQSPDLLQRVTSHRVSQILLSILKPAVKGWCFLSKG